MLNLNAELNPRLLRTLRCPVCGAPMDVDRNGRSLICGGAVSDRNPKGKAHLFDGGAGGYVNLAPNHSGGGDSKEAVRARSAFLWRGYYAPAAEAIAALVAELTPPDGLVLDAGCGEGYYSGTIAEGGYPTMGVDLSKFAVDAAAKVSRAYRLIMGTPSATLYVVGNVFELPVADGSFDTLVNVFAPCAPAEYARVLKPGGHLIVVGAGERHLFGLKELIYDDPYLNDPRRDLPEGDSPLRLVDKRSADFTVTVTDPAHREALFSMTPYYWRTSKDGRDRLAAAHTLITEVSFEYHVYQKV